MYGCLFAVSVLVKFVQFAFNVNRNVYKCKQDASLAQVRTLKVEVFMFISSLLRT